MTWIIKSLRNVSLSFLESQQPERAEIIREPGHFSAVTSYRCPDLLVVDILICQQSKHYGQEIICKHCIHFILWKEPGNTFVDINE